MTHKENRDHIGLPWPEAYAELLPLLREAWGVTEDIYLQHKLSGKSGALVYAADIQCSGFSGQAILKLDQAPDAESKETSEAERHGLAFEIAPTYAAEHLPTVLHTMIHGQSIAILSSIAGRGLEYAKPLAECSHTTQLKMAKEISKGLLEDWNSDNRLAKGMQAPQTLLRHWLGYRLGTEKGRVHSFLKEACGIAPDEKSIIFEGHWYPNPLAFAVAEPDGGQRVLQRAIVGNTHGDLHGFNVLVSRENTERLFYYLIDLAFYQDDQFLFYDHAYFELSHMLMMRDRADPADWISILDHLSLFTHIGDDMEMHGDNRGLLELMDTWRQEAMGWVDRHQANRLSNMESQYMLARVAVGLNFTHKSISDRSRRMAFLYAAANLKDYLHFNSLKWPKHGSLFNIVDTPQNGSVVVQEPSASESDQDFHDLLEHPTLPGSPAIAVLAFDNLSGDPEQEYFSDGITQEVITTLSRVDWLMVVASDSSFAYKGRGTDPKQIGQYLGVHYVVKGSVRRSDTRVRVSVQLIDARTSHHIWAEHFDRKIGDVFELQQEIAETISATIDSRLKFTERERARRPKSRASLWDRYQSAVWHFFKYSAEHAEISRQELNQLIVDAPDFANAHAALAAISFRRVSMLVSDRPAEDLQVAFEHATKAVSLDDASSLACLALSRVLMLQGKTGRAIDQARRAIAANPSSSFAQLALAHAIYWGGHAEQAVPIIERTIQLSSKGPFRDAKMATKAICNYALGELGEAEESARQVAHGYLAGSMGLLILAAVLARQGRVAEAGDIIHELAGRSPDITLTRLQNCWQTLAPNYLDMFVTDLRSAGLPE
jgi:TolB-like protein